MRAIRNKQEGGHSCPPVLNGNTVEFLGMWESLNNADFKPLEFEGFRNRSGLNSFVLTPRQWSESTTAVGIVSKVGCYGGTLAHINVALFGQTARQWRDANSDITSEFLQFEPWDQASYSAKMARFDVDLAENRAISPFLSPIWRETRWGQPKIQSASPDSANADLSAVALSLSNGTKVKARETDKAFGKILERIAA